MVPIGFADVVGGCLERLGIATVEPKKVVKPVMQEKV